MATSFTFHFAIASDGGPFTPSGDDTTITAVIDDGAVSVGDEVAFSGLSSGVLTNGGISGGTGHYLGNALFAGKRGYVFGENDSVGGNTKLLVLFDEDTINLAVGNAVRDFVNSPQPLNGSNACFLAGTLITTPDGDIPVENLRIGQRLVTLSCSDAQVRWVGWQTVSTIFCRAGHLCPIMLRAGSLGPGTPHSDLIVTADHALLVEGVLCNAGALVNGETIAPAPQSRVGDRFTIYHVDAARHEIILANGAPAESFIDNMSRRAFDNHADFIRRYGDAPGMAELRYPRAMSARQVPGSIRARLGISDAA